jgi:mRNA-degrading endonuclease RelE of RelBE toxin-antitoxin system
MMIHFDKLPEFQKELKRLTKKYRSLPEDLQEFNNVISTVPLGNNKHFITIRQTDVLRIIKARLFCRYLKGSSLRIIYAYFEHNQRIEFIELYHKGDKENEDSDRIEQYLSCHKV